MTLVLSPTSSTTWSFHQDGGNPTITNDGVSATTISIDSFNIHMETHARWAESLKKLVYIRYDDSNPPVIPPKTEVNLKFENSGNITWEFVTGNPGNTRFKFTYDPVNKTVSTGSRQSNVISWNVYLFWLWSARIFADTVSNRWPLRVY